LSAGVILRQDAREIGEVVDAGLLELAASAHMNR